MSADGSLLEVLGRLGRIEWSGETFRHTAVGRSPLSGVGARMFGGRWNPANSFPTIYLALSVETCSAEFARMAQGQARGTQSLPRAFHVIEVHKLDVIDLREGLSLAAVGLTLEKIQSRSRSECQAVGEAAHFLGVGGLLVPSATGVGDVLVVFEDIASASSLRVLTTELWDKEV